MLLLLQEPHLTTLFDLLEMLACFKPPSALGDSPEVGHGESVWGGGGAWVRAVCEGMSGVCEIPACFKLPRALGEGALDSPMVCTGRTKGVGRTVGVCVCV